MKITSCSIVVALAAATLAAVSAAPAAAQATRTWVSGVGDDVNPCSRTAPCKTFAGAISKTASAGEINCLDPGGFGAVTITKPLTIDCTSVLAGIAASGTNGINVSLASPGAVVLRGLDIHGYGTGTTGVRVTSANAAVVHIEKSIIRGFNSASAGWGVQFAPSAGPSRLYIEDTTIIDNGNGTSIGGGVSIAPVAGGNANVVIRRSRLSNNVAGVLVNSTAGTTAVNNVSIEDSEIAGNTNVGVSALSSGSYAPAKVMIDRTLLMANGPSALKADGTTAFPAAGSAVIRINQSVVTANPLTWQVSNSGQVLSYKNNAIDGNANDATPLSQISPN